MIFQKTSLSYKALTKNLCKNIFPQVSQKSHGQYESFSVKERNIKLIDAYSVYVFH